MTENTDRAQYEALGRIAAPERYTAQGRETWDRQRDLARAFARDYLGADEATGDVLFAYHCQATALKYSDRCGLKPGSDDAGKHAAYMAMVRHVLDGEPDPRAGRDDFLPYQEAPYAE